MNLVAVEFVGDTQVEVERILLQRFFRIVQGVGHLLLALSDKLEVQPSCQAMLLHLIGLSVIAIFVAEHTAYNGEKHGRASRPVFGIAIPKVFLALGILDALHFGTVFRYLHA